MSKNRNVFTNLHTTTIMFTQDCPNFRLRNELTHNIYTSYTSYLGSASLLAVLHSRQCFTLGSASLSAALHSHGPGAASALVQYLPLGVHVE